MNNARRVIIDDKKGHAKKIMVIFWLIAIIPLAAYFTYKFFYKEKEPQGQTLLPLAEQLKQATVAGALNSQQSTTSAVPQISEENSESESNESESSTNAGLDKTLLKIKVLNGSGFPGDAGKTAKILEEKGYKDIKTGDAGRYDYKTTIIEIKKEKEDYYFLLTQDLKEKYNEFVKQELEEKSEFDVIIIITK